MKRDYKSLFKFIYEGTCPFAVGFTTITVLQKFYPEYLKGLDPLKLLALLILLNAPVMIFYRFIGGILFRRTDPLVSKMMKCSLRKQYGLDYCVKCPDSYTCPTEV